MVYVIYKIYSNIMVYNLWLLYYKIVSGFNINVIYILCLRVNFYEYCLIDI